MGEERNGSPASARSQRRLRTVAGPLTGNDFILQAHNVIGRSGEANIQLADKRCSREHAVLLEQASGEFIVIDLGSSNGTCVGDETVKRRALHLGDEIRIGDTILVYEEIECRDSENVLDRVRLLSGRAQESTMVSPEDAPVLPSCRHPEHEEAIANGWRHCPQCGATASRRFDG